MFRLIRSRLSYRVAVAASALTLFVVLVTSGAAYMVMSQLIRSKVDELLLAEANQRADKLADLLNTMVANYRSVAGNPLVRDGVVQRPGASEHLTLLMAGMAESGGLPVVVSLTDMRGASIVSSAPSRAGGSTPWVAQALAHGTAAVRVSTEPGGPLISVVEPVMTAGGKVVRGGLLYRIRLADLARRMGTDTPDHAASLVLDDGLHHHEVAMGGMVESGSAALSAQARVVLPPMMEGVRMIVDVRADKSLLDAPLSRLTGAFMVIGIGTVLVVVVVSVVMGQNLTRALSRLADAASGYHFGRGTREDFAIRGEDEIARLGAAFRDMVGRLDQAYRDMERRSQNLLSNAENVAQVGSAVWDLSTGRQVWSGQFHAILGLDPTDAQAGLGALFDRVHPDDRAQLGDALQSVQGDGEGRLSQDFRIVRADGEERVGQLRGQLLRDGDQPVRLDMTLQDITERHRLEAKLDALVAELRRSNEELEQFAYVASHDLRQPLRVVGSYVTLIEEAVEDKLDGETREFMEFIRDGVRRMDLLITDLLAYSRVGRTSRDGAVDTGRALDLALMDLQVEIDEARAAVHHPSRMPVVTGDATEMARLFQNLVGNAVKYRSTDRRPEVTVDCADRGGTWEFSVVDNGIGIPPEHLGRVFGIFQRLHARDEYEGTGIGLAICKKIVERQGGQIWIESDVGQGTTFRFTWPKLRRGTEVDAA